MSSSRVYRLRIDDTFTSRQEMRIEVFKDDSGIAIIMFETVLPSSLFFKICLEFLILSYHDKATEAWYTKQIPILTTNTCCSKVFHDIGFASKEGTKQFLTATRNKERAKCELFKHVNVVADRTMV